MKKMIKANKTVAEFVDSWTHVDKELYPGEYTPKELERIEQLKNLNWLNINGEDIECIITDPVSLNNVIGIEYVDDETYDKLEDKGYDGGYQFTYRDGSKNTFGWLAYPNNLKPLRLV